MFYEFFDIDTPSFDNNASGGTSLSDAFESIDDNKVTQLTTNEIMVLESLADLYPLKDVTIGMEDGPFDDMGGGDAGMDAGGGDGTDGGDMPPLPDDGGGDMGGGMDDGGGGFDDIGGDMDSNPFGDDNGGMDGGDGMGDDGNGDDQNGDGQNQQQPKKLNRRKVIIDSTSIDTSIRGFIPQNFYKIIDVIDNNIDKIETLSSTSANQQKALASLVSVYTKMKLYLQDYFKTMPRRTYDDIFSEYVKTFYDMKKLRESYLLIMNEKDIETHDSIVAQFNDDLRILTKDDVKMHDKEEKKK